MKKITVLDRILYALNPKKSLQNFMDEAEKTVNEYALNVFGVYNNYKACKSRRNKVSYSAYTGVGISTRKAVNYRRVNMVMNISLAASSLLLAFLIYRLLT